MINAPVERVWEAITEQEQMKDWYFTIPDFKLEEGSIFNFYEPGDGCKYHHRCEIREIIPLERFQHTWTHPGLSSGVSLLTWELMPIDNQTEVTLTHEGIENLEDGGPDLSPENYEAGWEEIVGNALKNYVEGRAGL